MTTTLERFSSPRAVTSRQEILEICRFRAQVWQQTGQLADGAFGADGWLDSIDFECRHWAIRNERGALVATGRLSLHRTLAEVHQAEEYIRYGLISEGPVAAPSCVAVCPSAQGSGLGGAIVEVQDQTAEALGARCAVRQASPGMVRLIRRRGWSVLGPASPDARFVGVQFQVATKTFAACDQA
jgi:hypothetical protein